MNVTVTVIYPQEATFQVRVPLGRSLRDALSTTWIRTQAGDGKDEILTDLNKNGAKLRSSMVGDIYVVENRYFFVDSIGFIEIDQITTIKVQSLESRDRLMGYKWLTKHNGLPKQTETII